MLKRITAIIKEGEFSEEKEVTVLLNPSKIESVCPLDDGDIQTEIAMDSGDCFQTPLSMQEVEDVVNG